MKTAISRYDLIIIGGGPAGLTAALYGARGKLTTLIIEKALVGGLITETEIIDNYPGFPEGLSGFDLTDKMFKHAQKYGAEYISAEVIALSRDGNDFLVNTTGSDYQARAVIVAGGSTHQKLGVPGEEKYTGRGVAYCATCDAPFYTDKVVAVAGGGNTALYEALYLTKFAKNVYLIHRRAEYRATPIVQEQMVKSEKIVPILDTVIEDIDGGEFVEKLRIKNVRTSQSSDLKVDGIFIAVGIKPNTAYLKDIVDLDAGGFVIVNDLMATSVPGIFSAGDIRQNSIRQTVAACGDGAIAAVSANKLLNGS